MGDSHHKPRSDRCQQDRRPARDGEHHHQFDLPSRYDEGPAPIFGARPYEQPGAKITKPRCRKPGRGCNLHSGTRMPELLQSSITLRCSGRFFFGAEWISESTRGAAVSEAGRSAEISLTATLYMQFPQGLGRIGRRGRLTWSLSRLSAERPRPWACGRFPRSGSGSQCPDPDLGRLLSSG